MELVSTETNIREHDTPLCFNVKNIYTNISKTLNSFEANIKKKPGDNEFIQQQYLLEQVYFVYWGFRRAILKISGRTMESPLSCILANGFKIRFKMITQLVKT